MNVYDFDGTIYDGDSTIDFYFYCLKRQPRILRYVFKQIKGFILYKLKKISKTQLKETFFSFLTGIAEPDFIIRTFWEQHQKKIKYWYTKQKTEEDIIISASPEFLLMPLRELLCIQDIIATKVNKKTGEISGDNCYGYEKIIRFQDKYAIDSVDCFYSDSDSDKPFAQIAKKAYKVKKNKIVFWQLDSIN